MEMHRLRLYQRGRIASGSMPGLPLGFGQFRGRRMPEADGCRMENDVRAKSPEAGAGLPAGGERGVDPIPSIWSILKESACDK